MRKKSITIREASRASKRQEFTDLLLVAERVQSDGLFLVSLELLNNPLLFLFWRFFKVELLLERAVPLLLGLDCFSQLLFQRSCNGFNVLRLVFELQLRGGKRKKGSATKAKRENDDDAHRLVLLEVLFKLLVVLKKLIFLEGTGLILMFSLKVMHLRRLVELKHLQSFKMLNFLVLHELLG